MNKKLVLIVIIILAIELSGYGIISSLDLLNVKYKPTAGFGHFGRNDKNFTWEQTDKIDILQSAI